MPLLPSPSPCWSWRSGCPAGEGATAACFLPAGARLWPRYLGYVVSFWVIALYWVAHHRCFRYIRGLDRRLIYLNFLFLMFIAFMPFPTGLLFSNPAQVASVVMYAGAAAGMGFSLALVWITRSAAGSPRGGCRGR